jgi:2-hydroxychromene-2-carboxylate isomerase
MGDVICLSERRRAARSAAEREAALETPLRGRIRPRVAFYFDLASPWTYLAAELRLPLVWPDRWPGAVPAAMRVAALASERGHAAPFVLAAGRLAFCGGYDLEDPEILAEAAAAAGLPLDECLAAAGSPVRDAGLERAGLRLLAQGADALPALRVSRQLFCGEHRLPEAAYAAGLPLQRRRA